MQLCDHRRHRAKGGRSNDLGGLGRGTDQCFRRAARSDGTTSGIARRCGWHRGAASFCCTWLCRRRAGEASESSQRRGVAGRGVRGTQEEAPRALTTSQLLCSITIPWLTLGHVGSTGARTGPAVSVGRVQPKVHVPLGASSCWLGRGFCWWDTVSRGRAHRSSSSPSSGRPPSLSPTSGEGRDA